MAETKPVFTYVSIDYLRTHSTQIFNKTLEWVLMENFIPIDIFVDPICLYLLAKMLCELGFRLGCDSLTVFYWNGKGRKSPILNKRKQISLIRI